MKRVFIFIATAFMLAASASAQEFIDKVEGEAKSYTKTYDINYGGFIGEGESAATTIVYGSGNDVYFADPISALPTGTYVKGTLEGNKITVAYPQCIYATEEEGTYDYTLLEPTDEFDEETEMPIAKIMEPGTVTYTVGDDGVITLDPLPGNCGLGIVIAGTIYLGICEYNITFTPDEREQVTPPADLKTTTYSYKMNDNYGNPVQIGFDGSNVYFTEVSTDVPDLWFKGEIKDDGKIHIANRQFMGSYMGAMQIYTFLAKPIEEYPYMEPADIDAEYTYDYDPETGRIYNGSSDLVLLINGSEEEIRFLCKVSPNGFWLQDSYAGVPRNPYELQWAEGKNFNTFDFYLPNVDVDGNLMLTDNLYYNLFYDGELVEINPEEFGSDSYFTNIPFDYNKYMIVRDRIDGAHEIGVKVWGLETIGLQLINICDGKEYRSAIVELNLETGITTGLDNAVTGTSPVVSTEYFDLAGRRICEPGSGFSIQRCLHADGTVTTVKTVR